MKILSIGNSFSVDSQRYVRDIAKADGIDIQLGNLYIGGCSLETHVGHMQSGEPAYEYYENNVSLGAASIATALNDDDWDIVTLQQASHFSGEEDTYFPYIKILAEYVREKKPGAIIWVNQTWAYEYNSTHHAFSRYNNDRREMHTRLTNAYYKAATAIGAEIIPVGSTIAAARDMKEFDPELGGTQLSRDGFHLSLNLGRYMASAVWYETFTGRDIRLNSFIPMNYEYTGKAADGTRTYIPRPGSAPDEKLFALAREIVHNTCANAPKVLDTER